jgi:hypothetical protein
MVEIASAIYVVGQAVSFVFAAVLVFVAAWSFLGGR